MRVAAWRRGGLVPLALTGALMLSACDDDVAPPFDVVGTGGVEGLVFFDANEDGEFNLTSGDSALAGVDLVVRQRSTEQAFNDATATTGANGRFTVQGLPLGTHDLMIDTLSVPSGVRFCQNPLPVTVYRNEIGYKPVDGKASCLITIAEAEALAADQEYVTVSGVVTSSPDQITGDNTFIQDETGGIMVYGSLDPAIEVGDFLEVSGTIELFYTTLEITGPVVKTHIPDYGEVEPAVVTTDSIAATSGQPDAYIHGLLVTVEAAELTGEFGSAGHYRNAYINDDSGQTVLRLYEGVVEGDTSDPLNAVMSVGTCYDITGIVGDFSETAQLWPRSLDDIVEVPCT